MIFKWKFKDKKYPCVPYEFTSYEPMHEWEQKVRFAILPKRLWEYEERSSISMHPMIPDTYRMFTGMSKCIWLERYVEVAAYPRADSKIPLHKKTYRFAVDPYFMLISSM